MYIRRKVFARLTDEMGEEKLFSVNEIQKEFNSPAAKEINRKYIRKLARELPKELDGIGTSEVTRSIIRFGKGLGKAEASGKADTIKKMNYAFDNGIIIPKIRQRAIVRNNAPSDKLMDRQIIKEYEKKWGMDPEMTRDWIKKSMKKGK